MDNARAPAVATALTGLATSLSVMTMAVLVGAVTAGNASTFGKKRKVLSPQTKAARHRRREDDAKKREKMNQQNGYGPQQQQPVGGGPGSSADSGAERAAREQRDSGTAAPMAPGARLTPAERRRYNAALLVRAGAALLAFAHLFALIEGMKRHFLPDGSPNSWPRAWSAAVFVLVPEASMVAAWVAQLVVAGLARRDEPSPMRRLGMALALAVYATTVTRDGLAKSNAAGTTEFFVVDCFKLAVGALVLIAAEAFVVSKGRRSGPGGSRGAPRAPGGGNSPYTPLLDGGGDEEAGLSDGDVDDDDDDDVGGGEDEEREWWQLVFKAWTFLWPERLSLKCRVFACMVFVLFGRVFNVLVPLQYKALVDILYKASDEAPSSFHKTFFPTVLCYMLLFYVQGGGLGSMGLLSNTRQFLWIPVQQDTYKRVSLRAFEHIIDLPLSWHLGRRTGELLKILDRGTTSLTTILQILLFSVGPTLLDILVAATFFWINFDLLLAGIVFVTLGLYVPMTVVVTEWRVRFRREMNLADNRKTQRVSDAVLNYETIKYFVAEEHEARRYSDAIDAYQEKEFTNLATLNMLNVVQATVVFSGMAAGLSVITYRVCQSNTSGWTASDAVLFLSYLTQLYTPLNFLGSYYRAIQQALIDVENLLELFSTKNNVADMPQCIEYRPRQGALALRGVSFAYPGRAPVLKNVSFEIEGGKTVALVGATGCGKSTILRLLFRFYDPIAGSVQLDGVDIRRMSLKSLHRAIGVVPQDTVLFNDTITYNIGYGRQGASQEEVVEAAEAAQIHQTITEGFPSGYDTLVGERGLRLSGGEKQRVSFARAYLKRPAILLLDEATSSLDSNTEAKITQSLSTVRRRCTTVIVAHRLSTIADADMIIVMKDGGVAESGTHAQLLATEGSLYKDMWLRQAQNASTDDLSSLASS